MASTVRERGDRFVLDALVCQALKQGVESCNGESDPARPRLCRIRLDEERGVFVDVPENLIPDAQRTATCAINTEDLCRTA